MLGNRGRRDLSHLPASDAQQEANHIGLLLLLDFFHVLEGTHLDGYKSEKCTCGGDCIEKKMLTYLVGCTMSSVVVVAKVRGRKGLEAEVVCGTLAISELTHQGQSQCELPLCLENQVSASSACLRLKIILIW